MHSLSGVAIALITRIIFFSVGMLHVLARSLTLLVAGPLVQSDPAETDRERGRGRERMV